MADSPKNADDAKGKFKEGAGAVTGDKSLKNEGRTTRLPAASSTVSTRSRTPSPGRTGGSSR